jgi:hypothetical protein
MSMEKIIRTVPIQDAEDADLEYFSSLSPSEKFSLGLLLMEQVHAANPRLERLYRVVNIKEGPVSDGWRVGG